MNAADILSAVRQAGATLRIEGDSLVASNASRIAPVIKAAIRDNKPQIIAALVGSGCKVTIIEIPATGLRYRRTFARLQLKPPTLVEIERWRRCVQDGSKFLALWGERAEAMGWRSTDLFGLHAVPDKPHPSYQRLSRYDATGLIWLLQGRPVVALTETTASIRNLKTGNVTVYRKYNKPGLGPVGDSLEDFARKRSPIACVPPLTTPKKGAYRPSPRSPEQQD
jgi:hypothetical protein